MGAEYWNSYERRIKGESEPPRVTGELGFRVTVGCLGPGTGPGGVCGANEERMKTRGTIFLIFRDQCRSGWRAEEKILQLKDGDGKVNMKRK